MIETVILDWSGVVSDDWSATVAAGNDVLERWGHERISKEKFKELYELPWINFYKKLGLIIDEDKERKLWEKILPKYYNLVKILPNAKQAMEELKKINKKIVILSSHNSNLLIEEAKAYEVSKFIDAIHASVNDKRDEIKNLIAKHEAEPDKTVYVGDMVHDIETAKLAKVKSIAVLSGYDEKEKLEKAKPDYILQDIGELPALIETLDSDLK